MSNAPAANWLTQASFDRLTAELEELSGPRRDEVVERIAQAREEGDLKENGGYHAAKEEQGKIEARIRQLTAAAAHRRGGPGRRRDRRGRRRQRRHGHGRGQRDALPPRLPRDRGRLRHRRLQREQPARPGGARREGRRDRQLHGAERPRHRGADRRRSSRTRADAVTPVDEALCASETAPATPVGARSAVSRPPRRHAYLHRDGVPAALARQELLQRAPQEAMILGL